MDLVTLIESGTASLAYLALAGFVLGALHGLEPGHSKTMMAAFIIAVRGTPFQAFLLGLSAAVSHSAVVWVLAILALAYGDALIGEKAEPYFMMAAGGIVILVGAVMTAQLVRAKSRQKRHHHHHYHDDHNHHHGGHGHDHTHGRGDHDALDAHARAHAAEIEERFASGKATHWQTVGFGLSGGLIPCPAAITVLLLCLHIGQLWLGVGMVAAFSTGLAVTLVAVGLVAAIGLKYASNRVSSINTLFAVAPYLSGFLVFLVGAYMMVSGWMHLPA